MQKINWGIIGCGDVTELKSGPAFNKVTNSSLVAVMRRNGNKAKDYAQRHKVPKWYDDALSLINDAEVNAIYIATPPSTHEEYTLAAIAAGKPVYVEKPMTVNFISAIKMARAAEEKKEKLVVAHYRRGQPYFNKIKELLNDKLIGDVRFVRLQYYRKLLSAEDLSVATNAWRVDPVISGGGLFHDIAPHQIDLMYYFFGAAEKAFGFSINQSHTYNAADLVAGNILFKNNVVFDGLWSFNAVDEKDLCEINGSLGKISFSVFGEQKITLVRKGETEFISFKPPMHVQQPMIEKVVQYFLGKGPNPCSGEDGAAVMRLMDELTAH